MREFRDSLNLRDLGGIRMADGRTVRPGLIYRSGRPGDMNEREIESLKHLGLREILDLRSAQEERECPDPVLPGVHQVRISAMLNSSGEEQDYSPQTIEEEAHGAHGSTAEMEQVGEQFYLAMLEDSRAWKELFRCLIEEEVPLLFHCTAGKDRTGTAAALILLALGADDETILDDYMRSNRYRAHEISRFMQEHQLLLEERPDLQEVLLSWPGVRRGSLETVLRSIRSGYRDDREFLGQEIGLKDEDIAFLRDRYLEG